MFKLKLIVGIRIRVEIWVRGRVWVRLDSYDYSNIKDWPHQQGPYEVKRCGYRTISRVVVWFRGLRFGRDAPVAFRVDALVAFRVDVRLGFGVGVEANKRLSSASAFLLFFVLVQGVL